MIMTYKNWNAVKVVIREKFLSLQAYLKKQEKSQVNNLTLHLKDLQKEEQKQPKVSGRKEIIKIIAELNEIQNKKTIQKINRRAGSLKTLIKLTNPWTDLLKKRKGLYK